MDTFADKIMEKFLSEGASGDMSFVVMNISNFKQFFVKAIREYKSLNEKVVGDIISFHLNPTAVI